MEDVPGNTTNPFVTFDFYEDILFVVLFAIMIFAQIKISIQSLKTREMRNVFNYTILSASICCLLTRMVCLVNSLLVNDNALIDRDDSSHYFYFQLPYDLLNITMLTHLFQWIEALGALKS